MKEFDGWLRKGLGRAVLFLERNDGKPYRDAILHACTHNLAYDVQVEGERVVYLTDLIRLSSDQPFYRNSILATLRQGPPKGDNGFYAGQVFGLAGWFARQGDDEMKRALYSAFELLGFSGDGDSSATELVSLDGLAGLRVVVQKLDQVDKGDRPLYCSMLLEDLEKRDGKQALPSEFDAFVRECQAYEAECNREWVRDPRPSYEDLKRNLTRSRAADWARGATEDELAVAADDLLNETDPERLCHYLWIFRRNKFPKAIDRLIDLAHSENEAIARSTLVALGQVPDPRVRALGLDFLHNPKWRGFAVDLLVRNSQEGDYRILEQALLEGVDDLHTYHGLCLDVRQFCKAHPSIDAAGALLLLYENGTCALCRYGTVKQLIAIDRLPSAIREECAYDCYEDTRALVRQPQ